MLVSTGELYHVQVDFAQLSSNISSIVLFCNFRHPNRSVLKFLVSPDVVTSSIVPFDRAQNFQRKSVQIPPGTVFRNFSLGTTQAENASMINWMSINDLVSKALIDLVRFALFSKLAFFFERDLTICASLFV